MLKLNLNAKPFEPKKKTLKLDEEDTPKNYEIINDSTIKKIENSYYLNQFTSIYPEHYFFKGINDELEYDKCVNDNERECSICLDKILESNRRFGLLLNCTHVFCLTCIKQWRKSHLKLAKKEFHRLCPNCKVESYYVIPSNTFIEKFEVKLKIAKEYKESMSKIQCKYVKGGVDDCPFGSNNNRSGNTMEYDTLMVSSEGKLIKHEKYYSDYVKELLREVLN